MASMDSRINEFLQTHEIDESVKDSLVDLINNCFANYVSHMSAEWISSSVAKKVSTKSVKKADKTEDPTECESEDELNLRCTTVILDNYCRTHKLRIGGEGGKAARVGRVWRHMQGVSDENDFSPRNKPKATPAKKESHKCVCLTAKKLPCGSAATNLKEGHWFCYKHIDGADEWLSEKCEEIESSPKPVAKPVSKKPSASIKKKIVEQELESDDE